MNILEGGKGRAANKLLRWSSRVNGTPRTARFTKAVVKQDPSIGRPLSVFNALSNNQEMHRSMQRVSSRSAKRKLSNLKGVLGQYGANAQGQLSPEQVRRMTRRRIGVRENSMSSTYTDMLLQQSVRDAANESVRSDVLSRSTPLTPGMGLIPVETKLDFNQRVQVRILAEKKMLNERLLEQQEIPRWFRNGKSVKIGGVWFTIFRSSSSHKAILLQTAAWEVARGFRPKVIQVTYDELLDNVNNGDWEVQIGGEGVGRVATEREEAEAARLAEAEKLFGVGSLVRCISGPYIGSEGEVVMVLPSTGPLAVNGFQYMIELADEGDRDEALVPVKTEEIELVQEGDEVDVPESKVVRSATLVFESYLLNEAAKADMVKKATRVRKPKTTSSPTALAKAYGISNHGVGINFLNRGLGMFLSDAGYNAARGVLKWLKGRGFLHNVKDEEFIQAMSAMLFGGLANKAGGAIRNFANANFGGGKKNVRGSTLAKIVAFMQDPKAEYEREQLAKRMADAGAGDDEAYMKLKLGNIMRYASSNTKRPPAKGRTSFIGNGE